MWQYPLFLNFLVTGLEARGFLFGPMLALRLGCGFAPIRKKGKLPGECIQVSYTLEYGTVSLVQY